MHFLWRRGGGGGGGEESVSSRNSTFVYQLQQEVRTPCIANDIVPAYNIIVFVFFSYTGNYVSTQKVVIVTFSKYRVCCCEEHYFKMVTVRNELKWNCCLIAWPGYK